MLSENQDIKMVWGFQPSNLGGSLFSEKPVWTLENQDDMLDHFPHGST